MAEDVREMIVQQLVERRNRSDIIQAVCERLGVDWPHAEELVKQAELDQAHAIATRQLPMLVFLSACISAGGLLLVGYCIRTAVDIATHVAWPDVLLVLAGGFPIWLFILGLAMISGGVIGMHKSMLHYFET